MVRLTITDWDNGIPAVVAQWNKEHPTIQVQLIKPSGTGYTLYNKLITDNRAGTNPDISEVEYQALPEMVANKVASGSTSTCRTCRSRTARRSCPW